MILAVPLHHKGLKLTVGFHTKSFRPAGNQLTHLI